MTKRTRRTHSAAFKAKVVLAAVEGERTPVEFTEWKCHRGSAGLWRATVGGQQGGLA